MLEQGFIALIISYRQRFFSSSMSSFSILLSELVVSCLETVCFSPRNEVFHTEKPFVSHRETFCFKPG